MKINLLVTLLVVLLVMAYGIRWPLHHPDDSYQRITSNFGEYRKSPSKHIHAGVDMKKWDDNTVDADVYAVFHDYIKYINDSGDPETSNLRTKWYGYWHLDIEQGWTVGQFLAMDTIFGSVMFWDTQLRTHLHFSCFGDSMGQEQYAQHNHHPSQNLLMKLSPLNQDNTPPEIFGEILFAKDGDVSDTYSPLEIPANQDIDIIVHAEDSRWDHGFFDGSNGIYRIGYNIDYPVSSWNIEFNYEEMIQDWNVLYVYDTLRSTSSDYSYIVTNHMNSNGYWDTGDPAVHVVYVKAEDQDGNYVLRSMTVQVTTGIEEENTLGLCGQYRLLAVSPNPGYGRINIEYQIVTACQIHITIFDCMGRIIKEVHRKNNPGSYSYTWDGVADNGRAVPSGCYFIKFEADDYEAIQKFVLVK